MTQQRKIRFLNMWVLTDKMLFLSAIVSKPTLQTVAPKANVSIWIINYAIGYCKSHVSTWNSPGCNWRHTSFLQCSNFFLQKLKLRRTDCYSSAAMSWKDVGNIRSDCSSPPAKWVGSVWTVCLMSVRCGFSVHQLSWLIIHHCLFVFNEYLFTPVKWSWKVTMASHIYLQFQLNIISTFMAFIVLFKEYMF